MYCNTKEIRVIGDLPFYVCHDSADVWANPELFKLDSQKRALFVGGVPPDFFSRDGQLWGNPVYDWKEAERTSFRWWVDRIRHNLQFCDLLRLDHFRGFVAHWRVPAPAHNARKGVWARSGSTRFFKALKRSVPSMPFVAEDLGLITPCVRKHLKSLDIPGMRVLLFAFSGSSRNPHLPKNYPENAVVFTGTHDTNTAKGWFVEEATANQKHALFKLVGTKFSADDAAWKLIDIAVRSRARLSIVPMQDLLSLGSEARMNHPAKARLNWVWKLTQTQFEQFPFASLGRLTREAGR